jgi:hypothetical protein
VRWQLDQNAEHAVHPDPDAQPVAGRLDVDVARARRRRLLEHVVDERHDRRRVQRPPQLGHVDGSVCRRLPGPRQARHDRLDIPRVPLRERRLDRRPRRHDRLDPPARPEAERVEQSLFQRLRRRHAECALGRRERHQPVTTREFRVNQRERARLRQERRRSVLQPELRRQATRHRLRSHTATQQNVAQAFSRCPLLRQGVLKHALAYRPLPEQHLAQPHHPLLSRSRNRLHIRFRNPRHPDGARPWRDRPAGTIRRTAAIP